MCVRERSNDIIYCTSLYYRYNVIYFDYCNFFVMIHFQNIFDDLRWYVIILIQPEKKVPNVSCQQVGTYPVVRVKNLQVGCWVHASWQCSASGDNILMMSSPWKSVFSKSSVLHSGTDKNILTIHIMWIIRIVPNSKSDWLTKPLISNAEQF